MKKILMGMLIASSMLLGGNAYADGTSGCGLGSQIFKGKSGLVMHLFAATTNGSSYTNVFGVTSGTFGCNPDSSVQLDKQKETFIAVNHWNLSEEMSKGQGEYLVAYSRVMGCSPEVSNRFAEVTQQSYVEIFNGQNQPKAIIAATEEVIKNDASLAQNCSL